MAHSQLQTHTDTDTDTYKHTHGVHSTTLKRGAEYMFKHFVETTELHLGERIP
eukprot:m.11362 g.11362  ORF g.11362 m.11362 type:complete len:53 (+) comp8519_c0_seq1:97-255(+)